MGTALLIALLIAPAVVIAWLVSPAAGAIAAAALLFVAAVHGRRGARSPDRFS